MPSLNKLKDRGFWVSHHFYWQSLVHYFIESARFRSFTFFSACDPAIDLGGMLDENKSDIYDILPKQFVPVTIKVRIGDNYQVGIKEARLEYPLIIKPNIGFKGYKVFRADNEDQLMSFLSEDQEDREWLIQEYLHYQREYSLLFYRYPDGSEKGISSLIEKLYPAVVGDGKTRLRDLVNSYHNPFIDREILTTRFSEAEWSEIKMKGEKVILDTIGNYSRGSKFYSLMDEIDEGLINATSVHFAEVKGLDFFRMDFKADSLEGYKKGEFGILEVNGAKSEPLHIYDPQLGFGERVRILKQHWSIIRGIVKSQVLLSGYQFPTTRYGLKALFAIKRLVK